MQRERNDVGFIAIFSKNTKGKIKHLMRTGIIKFYATMKMNEPEPYTLTKTNFRSSILSGKKTSYKD